MGDAWQRDCVPLEVEMISLHRGTPRPPRRAREPRRRPRLIRRLLTAVRRVCTAR
ncbi:hypothetical protein ACVW00_002041 [Marmoricola sp. URHA0025 HA25]